MLTSFDKLLNTHSGLTDLRAHEDRHDSNQG